MTVLIHAHSSDILDMKSLVKFAQQVGPFDSNKETKFFFFYPVPSLLASKDERDITYGIRAKRLKRSDPDGLVNIQV